MNTEYTGRCSRKYIQGGNRPTDTYDEGVEDLEDLDFIQSQWEFRDCENDEEKSEEYEN